MICEICHKELKGQKQDTWGIQVMKGTKSEFHYYCSGEHAKEGERNLGYKVVGEIVDA